MLARAATREHGDADAAAHGVVVVVVRSSCRVGRRRHVGRRDVRRRRRASRRRSGPPGVLPGGSCEMTTPSNVSTSVSCCVTATLKPGGLQRRPRVGDASGRHVRHGVVCGPFETESVTDEPLRRRRVARRALGDDDPRPAGRSRRRRDRRRSPADWSCGAPRVVEPTTVGTAIGFGPVEKLIRTDAPSTSTVPARGSCAVTMPDGARRAPRPLRVEAALRQRPRPRRRATCRRRRAR